MLGQWAPLNRLLAFFLQHGKKQQMEGVLIRFLQCLHFTVPYKLLAFVNVVVDFGKVLKTGNVFEQLVLLILLVVVLLDRDALPRLLHNLEYEKVANQL